MTEEKTRIHTRISPETEQKIAAAMPLSNCRSQNEFVEKALHFYCEHLTAQDTFSALPPVLLSAIRATVQASEDRICRLQLERGIAAAIFCSVSGEIRVWIRVFSSVIVKPPKISISR